MTPTPQRTIKYHWNMRTIKPDLHNVPERYLDTNGGKRIDLLTVEEFYTSHKKDTWAFTLSILSIPFFIVLTLVLSVAYGPFSDGGFSIGCGFLAGIVSFLLFGFLDWHIGSYCRVTLHFYGGGIEQFKNKARDHDAIYKALRERFHDHDGRGWQCPHPMCPKG